MKYYSNAAEVQAAYLAEALSTECPKRGYFECGKLLATSTSDKPFFYAKNCPTAVKAKVANTYIKDGKVKDEAPIQIISGTPEGFLDGVEKVFAFTTPGLGDNNLKVTVIEKGVIWSECEFPAGHNFAVKAEAITVNMYRSVFGGFYTEENLPENDQSKCVERYTAAIRSERTARLSDTNFLIEIPDYTIKKGKNAVATLAEGQIQKAEAVTDEERELLIQYRQELKDMPELEGFPFVDFPEPPDFCYDVCMQKINQRAQSSEMR